MGILLILFIIGYSLIFYFFVLNFYWAIPINILIGIVLGAISMVLIFLGAIPIIKIQKTNNRLKSRYYSSWGRLLLFFMRISVKYEGRENIPSGAFLLCPNHKSYCDIFFAYLAVKCPMAFISKPENFKIPIVNKYMEGVGCIPINRQDDREAVKGILAGIKVLKEGLPVCVFPEGGIKSRVDEHMVDLKAGAYKLATKSNVPIVPMTIIGATTIKDKTPFHRVRINVIIHKPITPEEYNGLNTHEIGTKVMDIVNSRIK